MPVVSVGVPRGQRQLQHISSVHRIPMPWHACTQTTVCQIHTATVRCAVKVCTKRVKSGVLKKNPIYFPLWPHVFAPQEFPILLSRTKFNYMNGSRIKWWLSICMELYKDTDIMLLCWSMHDNMHPLISDRVCGGTPQLIGLGMPIIVL